MYSIFGFGLAIFFVHTALDILNVDRNFFVDEVAFLLVFGGTLGAMVVSFPPEYLYRFFKAPLEILRSKRPNLIYSIENLIRAASQQQSKRAYLKKILKDPKVDSFLQEGVELLFLDLKVEDFKNIMTERIYRSRQRDEEWVNLFRRLSKYPPAFGLVGTVLGLVSLMRSVGAGANAAEIGLNMALALVATLYGLAFANFVLAPIAEHFQNQAEENKVFRELMYEGLLMIHQESDSIAVQEMLNSYLPRHKRVDILGVSDKVSA